MKILRIIVSLFFKTAVTLFCLSMLLPRIGLNFYIVPTGSMEPSIHAGSFVLINEKADYSKIQKGDIIVYSTDKGNPIIHRAIDISSQGIVVQGDANPIPDNTEVTKDNFIGKFLFGIPFLGRFLQIFNNIYRKIIGTVTLLILFCVDLSIERKNRRSLNTNQQMKGARHI